MTNTEILMTKGLLTNLDSQRRFLLRHAVTPMLCPNCGASVSQVQAYGDGQLDSFPVDSLNEYTCPECKEALCYVLPLFGAPCWALKRALDAAEARRVERGD